VLHWFVSELRFSVPPSILSKDIRLAHRYRLVWHKFRQFFKRIEVCEQLVKQRSECRMTYAPECLFRACELRSFPTLHPHELDQYLSFFNCTCDSNYSTKASILFRMCRRLFISDQIRVELQIQLHIPHLDKIWTHFPTSFSFRSPRT
jgi:hypothetical protein